MFLLVKAAWVEAVLAAEERKPVIGHKLLPCFADRIRQQLHHVGLDIYGGLRRSISDISKSSKDRAGGTLARERNR